MQFKSREDLEAFERKLDDVLALVRADLCAVTMSQMQPSDTRHGEDEKLVRNCTRRNWKGDLCDGKMKGERSGYKTAHGQRNYVKWVCEKCGRTEI